MKKEKKGLLHILMLSFMLVILGGVSIFASGDETGKYISTLSVEPKQHEELPKGYYADKTFQLKHGIELSGNELVLEAGSYTKLYFPKQYFSRTRYGENYFIVNEANQTDLISSNEIVEEDDYLIYKTEFKKLTGGDTLTIPLEVALSHSDSVNGTYYNTIPYGTEIKIKQEFFTKDGTKLSHAEAQFTAKTVLEGYNNKYSDDKGNVALLKEMKATFSHGGKKYSFIGTEPGGRRLYAKFTRPEGKIDTITLIDPDSEWKWDDSKKSYYKDIKKSSDVDEAVKKGISIDLSKYDFSKEDLEFRVNFELKALDLDTMQVKENPKSTKWISSQYFYTEKEQYKVKSFKTRSSHTYVDGNYRRLKGERWIHKTDTESIYQEYLPLWKHNLPLEKEEVQKEKIWIQNQVIHDLQLTDSSASGNTPVVGFWFSRITLTPDTYGSELQLRFDKNVSEAEKEKIREKFSGTKVYGDKNIYGMDITLISDNVPIVFGNEDMESDDYFKNEDSSKWIKFDGKQYKSIMFVFPKDKAVFEGKEEIEKYQTALKTNVIAKYREDDGDYQGPYSRLKDQIEKGESAEIWDDAHGNSNVRADIVKRVKANDSTMVGDEVPKQISAHHGQILTIPHNRMHPTELHWDGGRETDIYINKNSSSNDREIQVSLSYDHEAVSGAEGIAPKNLRIYYLFPDGVEPILEEDEENAGFDDAYYGDWEVQGAKKWNYKYIKGFHEGKSLLIHYPETDADNRIPSMYEKRVQLGHTQKFRVTDFVEAGKMEINAVTMFDNNQISFEKGGEKGIHTKEDIPEVWKKLLELGKLENHPKNPKKVVAFSNAKRKIIHVEGITAKTKVKMREEAENNFVSDTGEKAKAGSEIDYELSVVNNTKSTKDKLMILNILPKLNDKNIVKNSEGKYLPRGSQFETKLTGIKNQDDFDLYYSVDEPKEKVEDNLSVTWLTEAPADLSKVTMIKAVLKSGKKIAPNQKYSLITSNVVDNNKDLKDEDFAYNSFAYSLDGGNTFLEALRASVKISIPEKRIHKKKYDVSATIKVKKASDSSDKYVEKYPDKLPENTKVSYELRVKNTGKESIESLVLFYNMAKPYDYFLDKLFMNYVEDRGSKFYVPFTGVMDNDRVKVKYHLLTGNEDEDESPLFNPSDLKPDDMTKVKTVSFEFKEPFKPDEELILYTENIVVKEKDTKDGDSAFASFAVRMNTNGIRSSNIAEIKIDLSSTNGGGGGPSGGGGGNGSGGGGGTPIIPSGTIPEQPIVVTEEVIPLSLIEKIEVPTIADLDPETTEIDFDETPRGDADLDFDVEEDEIPQGDKEMELEGDEEVEGKKLNRKALAKTGGLNIALIQRGGLLLLLLVALMSLHIIKRRDEKLIK